MKRVVGFALFFVAIGMIFSYLVEGFLEFLLIVIFFFNGIYIILQMLKVNDLTGLRQERF